MRKKTLLSSIILIYAGLQNISFSQELKVAGENTIFSKDGLPCLDSICIGEPISSLNIELLSLGNIKDHIEENIDVSEEFQEKKINEENVKELYKSAISSLIKLDTENFINLIHEFSENLNYNNKQKILDNSDRVLFTINYIKDVTRSQSNENIITLVNYFTPVRSHSTGQYIAENFYNETRLFDSKFNEIISRTKPIFCYPIDFKGIYESKNGYVTIITATPDLDGTFRISQINRTYPISDVSQEIAIKRKLIDAYKEFEINDASASMLVSVDGVSKLDRNKNLSIKQDSFNLILYHPMLLKVNDGYEQDGYQRWSKGWMQLKGNKNIAIPLESLFAKKQECLQPDLPIN